MRGSLCAERGAGASHRHHSGGAQSHDSPSLDALAGESPVACDAGEMASGALVKGLCGERRSVWLVDPRLARGARGPHPPQGVSA